jgi:hypothetical protein
MGTVVFQGERLSLFIAAENNALTKDLLGYKFSFLKEGAVHGEVPEVFQEKGFGHSK